MSSLETVSDSAHFRVENIGGIDKTEVSVPPGVTILTGENATNRTSFLQSIMAAMGSSNVSLKGDAETGSVTLEIDDKSYKRSLTQADDQITFAGDSYLNEPEVADLFAFLLESNEARQAVSRGDELREVIMRPVDVDEIKSRIRELESEKRQLNTEIEQIESKKNKLPKLEERRTSLQNEIEAKRESLEQIEAEIEAHSTEIEQGRSEEAALESKLDELKQTRSELESVRQQIEIQSESITSLKRERNEISSKLDDIDDQPKEPNHSLEAEIDQLRDRRQSLTTEINELRNLIEYNEKRLSTSNEELLELEQSNHSSLTDQLIEADTVTCWTCGSTVERSQITSTVDRLKNLRTEKMDKLAEIKEELQSVKSDQKARRTRINRIEQLESKLDEITAEIERRESKIEELKSSRVELTSEVEALETAVEELESADFDEILSLHKEANQLEFDIDRIESKVDEITAQIETIEDDIERSEELRKERETTMDALTDQRTMIEQIEAEAVESFNDHMQSILKLMGYENIERIWIERIDTSETTNHSSHFELHIIRTTESGIAYEDTVEHLSESEREVTGLIFALAGYLVHDLHETVPFMLLDSLEAIDSPRIATLVDYFAEFSEFLIVALLPEDASELDDSYTRVTDI